MQTLLDLAAAHGWYPATSPSRTEPGVTFATFGHPCGLTALTWWYGEHLHSAYLYRGQEFEPYATTMLRGVVVSWVALADSLQVAS